MLFSEQKYKVFVIANGKSHTHLWRDEPCALARI